MHTTFSCDNLSRVPCVNFQPTVIYWSFLMSHKWSIFVSVAQGKKKAWASPEIGNKYVKWISDVTFTNQTSFMILCVACLCRNVVNVSPVSPDIIRSPLTHLAVIPFLWALLMDGLSTAPPSGLLQLHVSYSHQLTTRKSAFVPTSPLLSCTTKGESS